MDKWKNYYLNVCDIVSENSSCLSRQVGAIIVRDKSIISTGYNGPPRGVPHCDKRFFQGIDKTLIKEFKEKGLTEKANDEGICPRQLLGYKSGEGLHLCIAGHAERNALINAAREGVSVKGATMYMNCSVPCKDCLIEIINAGIKKIVVLDTTFYDDMSKFLLVYSGLEVDIFE